MSKNEQKPVLLVIDEVQNILNLKNVENLPLARYLGPRLVMTTQNINGLFSRLSEKETYQILENFSSLIYLPSKTNFFKN